MKKGKFGAVGAVILLLLLFWLYRGSSDSSTELSTSEQNTSSVAVSMQTDSDSNSAEEDVSELTVSQSDDSEADTSESMSSESEAAEADSSKESSESSVPRDREMEAKILAAAPLDEDGFFYSEQDVATYLYQYGKLPSNYLTKTKAKKLGWDGGSLDPYKEGGAIGGGLFMNNEGLLPDVDGSSYRECDIDTKGDSARGTKRLVYSDDGRIYYTEDHYESFVQLVGPSVE